MKQAKPPKAKPRRRPSEPQRSIKFALRSCLPIRAGEGGTRRQASTAVIFFAPPLGALRPSARLRPNFAVAIQQGGTILKIKSGEFDKNTMDQCPPVSLITRPQQYEQYQSGRRKLANTEQFRAGTALSSMEISMKQYSVEQCQQYWGDQCKEYEPRLIITMAGSIRKEQQEQHIRSGHNSANSIGNAADKPDAIASQHVTAPAGQNSIGSIL
jgi:hypothetical protein